MNIFNNPHAKINAVVKSFISLQKKLEVAETQLKAKVIKLEEDINVYTAQKSEHEYAIRRANRIADKIRDLIS